MKWVFIEVPSDDKSGKKVSARIMNSLSPYSLQQNRLFDIKLSVEEAVRNAVVHGNKSNPRLFVRVNYKIESDQVKIEVEDEGAGFDPASIPDPTNNKEAMLKESGRGVWLIKKLMDKVDFNVKGNKIKMVKFF